ncbi:MAG: transketolase-like TK C-terminal-containing protein [Chthoniobacterales bacterium]
MPLHETTPAGEDGPTHEPVETVASLPGHAAARCHWSRRPTLLALTRQVVPLLGEIDVTLRREGVLRGGYIAKNKLGKLDLMLLSCGSELQHALAAAKELGEGARVVSMPCFERFERQPESYRAEAGPNECRKRGAIEAGVPQIWVQYVGLDDKIIGIDRFGMSAPGNEVMKELGIDAQHVIDAAKSLG